MNGENMYIDGKYKPGKSKNLNKAKRNSRETKQEKQRRNKEQMSRRERRQNG